MFETNTKLIKIKKSIPWLSIIIIISLHDIKWTEPSQLLCQKQMLANFHREQDDLAKNMSTL